MGKTAFIFSGQGSQYVGMGKDLYDNFSAARKIYDEADEVLNESISKFCFEGPEEKLQETEITQPAVLTHSIACYSVLKEEGIIPDMVAGLSLGEYSALVASESLEFCDAVPLVKKRGKYMQEAVPIGKGTMAAIIGLERDQVIEICREAADEGVVEAANFNCPGQIVVAGEVKAVNKAVELAKSKGAKKAVMLAVSAPFHCSLLKPAADKLARELDNVVIKENKIPLVSNVNADFVSGANKIKQLLIKQMNSPVFWEDCIKKMISSGVDTFIEVGPGKALSSFVKKIDKTMKVANVEDKESLYRTIKSLGG